MRNRCLILLGLLLFAAPSVRASEGGVDFEQSATWPVQADGRVKPLDTLARESVKWLSGRSGYEGRTDLELVWELFLNADQARDWPLVRVDNMELKALFGDPTGRRFSSNAIAAASGFRQILERGSQKPEAQRTPLERDALGTWSKLSRLEDFFTGQAFTIVPRPAPEPWTWPDLASFPGEGTERSLCLALADLGQSFRAGDHAAVVTTFGQVSGMVEELRVAAGPTVENLAREVHLNRFNPLGKAWVFYLVGTLLMALFGSRKKSLYWGSFVLLVAGLVLHSYAMYLRWKIGGRAPLSNMYESLLAMTWGISLFALIVEAVYRLRFPALAGGALAFIGLSFSEHLPLDSSISPLVPVLANTAWLAIHVITIMLAYSALALALGVAHLELWDFLRHPKAHLERTRMGQLLHRLLLVGVLFLTAGIAFGAIWANKSWGRYWGWDPKETWSLITLFGYLAIIHARYIGWIHHFGTAVLSVLAFQLVIMTYYGVNFVLGAGLHSYGFSSGGVRWVLAYLGLESLFLLIVWLRYRGTRPRGDDRLHVGPTSTVEQAT